MPETGSIPTVEAAARRPPTGSKEAERRVATLEIDPVRGAIVRVELAGSPDAPGIDLGAAEAWELVLSLEGRPCRRLLLPDPGPADGAGLLEEAAMAACRVERARELVARSLRRRMGGSARSFPALSVTVVVCTRGRRRSLAALLGALGALDPAPQEIVVVDNAPGVGEDCRELAEGAGAVYVREDTPGLNSARRAGVAAARGDLLAFTDDDCLPPPHWLAVLPELFDDQNVVAATGPGFPAALDTRPQLRFERAASFSRGFERREWDFTLLSPALAARAGAGANMVLRAEALASLGEIFAPELDAGTPTCSGGDTYVLFKALASGGRVVYEPRLYTYHRHRADARELHRSIRGYGVGLGAVAAKLAADEREPGALLVYGWLIRQYVGTVAKGLVGERDSVEVRLAWDYLRGGLAGPAAWRRSRRRDTAPPPSTNRSRPGAGVAERPPSQPGAPVTEGPPSPRPDAGNGAPEVSVVVITHRPGKLPGRCLDALAAQTGAPPFEVILVDDASPGAAGATPIPAGLRLRRLRTGGRGAAAARNAGAAAARGELLIFLDDDLVPRAELVATHARRQRSEDTETVVVGYSPPRPLRRTLVALTGSLWWEDHFRAKREGLAPTFTEMLSGNVSVRRETFERVGEFDADFGSFRREDWEWGIRALERGIGLAYEPHAVADHRFSLDTRGRLRAAHAEGAGDALLVARHPFALPSLPAGRTRAVTGVSSRLTFRLLLDDRLRERSVIVLDAIERLRMRRIWARWFAIAQLAAYEAGFGDRRRVGARGGQEHSIDVELDSDELLPPPRVAAPRLKLAIAGRQATGLNAVDGQWTASLADRIARGLSRPLLERLASRAPTTAPPAGEGAGIAVVFGPACSRPERIGATALARAGAELRPAGGAGRDPVAHWRAVDRAVRGCASEIVAVPLPGVELTSDWLEPVASALRGERVAVLTGGGLEAGTAPGLVLHSRATLDKAYPVVGSPSRYVAVRRGAYVALGGFDPAAAELGHQGPVLDLLERALDSGWVVGYRDAPGIAPSGGGRRRRRAEWERWRARGGLMRRRARTRGLGWWLRAGLVPIVARILRAPRKDGDRLRGAVGSAAAFLAASVAPAGAPSGDRSP